MKNNRFHMQQVLFLGVGFLLLGFLLSLQPAPALAEEPLSEIDSYIEERMRELQIPGLAVAIVRGDEIVYSRGYGIAGPYGRPVTAQTPFLITSMSKSITALGVMQLIEEGKLRLDAPVQEYLHWFGVADSSASSQITVRHLLNQTSGFSELKGYQANLNRSSGEGVLEASVRRLRNSRLNASPGESFEYSNTNYDILGLLIQIVSGKPYESYIQEKIFSPLQMQSSYTSLEEARRSGLSSGTITFFGKDLVYDRFMPYSRAVVPSAGLFSSAEDMARYLFAHLNDGRTPDGTALLSPAGIAQLHTPGVQINENVRYAMGWTVFPFPEAAPSGTEDDVPIGLSHGGRWANYRSIMLLVPEQNLGVAVLMNKNEYRQGAAYDNIGWNTALLALGLPPLAEPQGGNRFLSDTRYIVAVVLLLLLAGLIKSVRWLSRPFSPDPSRPVRWQFVLVLIVLPLLDLATAGYLLLVHLPQSSDSLPLVLNFEPDTGLMYLSLLVLTLGWGTVRTVLAGRKLSAARRVEPTYGAAL
jgi:CubicO group peptidase (beta-lactamase class C family)